MGRKTTRDGCIKIFEDSYATDHKTRMSCVFCRVFGLAPAGAEGGADCDKDNDCAGRKLAH
jgi:hypothetical protein